MDNPLLLAIVVIIPTFTYLVMRWAAKRDKGKRSG